MSCLSGKMWYEIVCPDGGCGAINFIYGGYFPNSDSSTLDVDGFVCWKCRKEFAFFEDEEPFYTQEGQKQPGSEI